MGVDNRFESSKPEGRGIEKVGHVFHVSVECLIYVRNRNTILALSVSVQVSFFYFPSDRPINALFGAGEKMNLLLSRDESLFPHKGRSGLYFSSNPLRARLVVTLAIPL